MKIFGVDLGVASIGWALIDDEQQSIIDCGVRIFTQSTNKDGKTFASIRREHRGVRRTLRRRQQRIKLIRKLLVNNKVITQQELKHLFNQKNRIDVWQLRSKALGRKLTPSEWGRVLLHIAKRRAYQSNRKSEELKNIDSKKVLKGIEANKQEMILGGYKTIGAMIYDKTKYPGQHIRRNKKDKYDHSVSRDLLREEIDTLFITQKRFDNKSTDEKLKDQYKETAFTQLPIQFDANMVGDCTFEKGEKRGAKNAFSVEKSVLLSKINNTDLLDFDTGEIIRLFDYVNVDNILNIFYKTQDVKYSTLRKQLNIANNFQFKQINYHQDFERKKSITAKIDDFYKMEDWLNNEQKAILEKRVLDVKEGKFKRYKYSSIRSILSLASNQKFKGVKYDKNVEDETFGKLEGYHKINKSLSTQVFKLLFSNRNHFNKIAEIISYTKDDVCLRSDLQSEVFDSLGIDADVAQQSIESLIEISFSGFNNLSVKAIDNLLPHLENGLKYHEAVAKVYEHHSQFKNTNPQKYLRPLNEKENNQLTNPTVKRTFSQFRKVLNAVIRKHGGFDVMHIEMARDLKNSKHRRIEIAAGQKEFRQEKEALEVKFKEVFGFSPKEGSSQLLKLRLYEQQQCKSIYSDQTIDVNRLFEHGYVEVDHILPWSRTFDNSLNNKALCLAQENQNKGNKTPFEYLANGNKNNEHWHWFSTYVNSLKGLKKAKRNKLLNVTLPKRRGSELSDGDIENPEDGFLARNLNDTAYASRFIKNFVQNYLEFNENKNIKQKVKVRAGALTDQLRYNWGIDSKNRNNNLHHAEDAIILAFATQNEVKRMSTIAAQREDFHFQTAEQRKIKFTPPFEGFKEELSTSIDNVFVSFAPRRKISGAAHKATIKSSKTKKTKYKFRVNQGLAEKGEIKRIDIFSNEKGHYKFIPFYPHHFYQDELPNKDLKGEELPNGFKFLFSLFKDDLIEFKSKKDKQNTLAYFKYIYSDGRIIYQLHFKAENEREPSDNDKGYKDIRLATGPSLSLLIKYQVSVLGDYAEVKGEKRLPVIKQMQKNKRKKKG